MARIPEHIVENIREVADVYDIVSEYVRLKKRGRNFFGLCPFHDEKTPSFSINMDKQIYKCFGCGKGGGTINFVMDVERLDFVDALKFLGNKSGGGYADDIGVGDSTTAAAVGQTDLQGTAVWKTIVTADRVFITPTLYLSVEFGYSEANFTWNELGIRDNQGTPVLWARQIDASPLAKTSSKRAIVEWQLSL